MLLTKDLVDAMRFIYLSLVRSRKEPWKTKHEHEGYLDIVVSLIGRTKKNVYLCRKDSLLQLK